MTDQSSWADRAADAAKGLWVGAETAAIIATSPAAGIADSNLPLTDPVTNSGVSALAAGHEALTSAVEARGDYERVGDETDVAQEPTTSLTVDPPSWLSEPSDLEASINDDLARAWVWDDSGDLGNGDLGTDDVGSGFF